MRRRGPDAAAFVRQDKWGGRQALLLHSRLSIIDLADRANQPFRCGEKTIVFNGEIYNYRELRAGLEARGRQFVTASDTEVLAATLDEYGLDGLDLLEGMWAFALHDAQDGSLLLSRDRFGEKPLALMWDENGGVYFGSEPKFLFALAGRQAKVNTRHLLRYMVNGYKALYKTPETFFEGVKELAPAHILQFFAAGDVVTRRYWTPAFRPDDGMSYATAVAGAREHLLTSVQLRLRADVPMAFCLSGGIDSNALVGIAKNVYGYDVHGFTIVNTDCRYEEQELVEHARDTYGIRHTSIPVRTGGFLSGLRQLVRQHDAPVYTITYYAHWLLMESIAQHGYRISVSGTAADELFSGYFDHHLAYLYEVRNEPALFQSSLQNWERHIKPVVRNPFLQNPRAFIENPGMRGHIYLEADNFENSLTCAFHEAFREEHYAEDLLRNRMMNELFHESVPVILHEDDLNAMYYSIENRSPFLDRGLFDFCATIPTRHLVREGCAKAVLRDAMRGIVPDKILNNRRKVGFNAPIFSFLDIKAPETRAALLDDSPVFDLVRKDVIERFFNRDDLPNSESKFLFYFLNTKMFLEEFA
jgi:asparagine synthase (glutamine-hydrolysing)